MTTHIRATSWLATKTEMSAALLNPPYLPKQHECILALLLGLQTLYIRLRRDSPKAIVQP